MTAAAVAGRRGRGGRQDMVDALSPALDTSELELRIGGSPLMFTALEQAVLADRSQRFAGGARRRGSGT